MRGVPSDCNSATPAKTARSFAVSSSPHRCEGVIGVKFGPLRTVWLPHSAGISWKESNECGITPPVELCRQMPAVLKIDKDGRFSGRLIRHDYFRHSPILSTYGYVGLLAYGQGRLSILVRSLSSRSSFFSRTHLTKIHDQQADSSERDSDLSPFFPWWGIVLALIGVVAAGWGWWNLRDGNRPPWSEVSFYLGLVMWGRGLARLITF